jgi:hypothetical protein
MIDRRISFNPHSRIRDSQSAWLVMLLAGFLTGAARAEERYLNYEEMTAKLRHLAAAHPERCTLSSIGRSRAGRDLWAVRLAADGPREPENRSALLIVAGLDGSDPAGSAVALGEIERLLAPASEQRQINALMSEHTVFVLPRMNPDALESYFAHPQVEQRLVLRPVDDDRDGAIDEDGPEDINGDGLITLMRVKDPEKADSLPDPGEPRLMKKADPVKGDAPAYVVYMEGIDNDGDERFNEDPPGGVELNRNFLHGYREHSEGAGPYQLCEVESRGLVDFVLAHPRIAITIVYGQHDNVIETPKGEKKDQTGQAPVDLHSGDVSMYREISERFRKLTELKNPPKSDASGAFFAWSYAQLGVPTFAVPTWPRPDEKEAPPPPPESQPGDSRSPAAATQRSSSRSPPMNRASATSPDAAESQDRPESEIADESAPQTGTTAESQPQASIAVNVPSVKEKVAAAGGVVLEKIKDWLGGGKKEEPAEKREPDDKEAAAWLMYSDKVRSGAGFIPWTPFEHPQLGAVEIGGFAPFFRTTPPESDLPRLTDRHLAFVLDLADRFPVIDFCETKVKPLAPGVYEIETLLVNSGYFPSATAMGLQNRRVRPAVVTLDLPLDRILGGERVQKVWSLAGSGGRKKFRWVIRGTAGESLNAKVTSEKLGDFNVRVVLPGAE